MFRYLIILLLILLTDFSFGQIVFTQTHNDATIGIDRKAWSGLGNTSPLSDGYAHDFTLPARTNPCQQITGIRVEITHSGYTNNSVCPHFETFYNLFYGCTSYTGGATCLPATNLIAEPNYGPTTSPPPFNFGNPLGSPYNGTIVPDFGDNLSVDIIPVSIPGCNPVTNGHISYQYTITVTVTVTDMPPTPPTFTQVPVICNGDTLSALPTTSNNSITGTWAPALDNTATTTYLFTPDSGQCATNQTMTITVNTPVTPTLACWQTATINNTTCTWEITGTQPVQPTTQCWETATFNTTSCAWEITGTQPVQPTTQCWQTATFNNTTCIWEITGTQPVQPPTQCWETANFNTTSCSWEITGTQPFQPTTQCWETATFNNTNCIWEVTGTQPGQVFNESIVFCSGQNQRLNVNTSIPNPSYLWNTGETAAFISVNTPGAYSVEITSSACFFETRNFNVTQAAIPSIETISSDGNNIVVTTSITGDFLYSINGNIYQPSNTFYNVKGGLYTVYVKEQNCPEIVTQPYLHFYIPKYFTPNNDGVNDTFSLSGIEFYGASQVSIFNRYGKLVKFSQNGPFSWDGTFNNAQLPSDDYWYVIIIDGQKFKGHFTLKR